jgi:hypothetical protein
MVAWEHTVRNAWSLDQTSARSVFAATSATPQDGTSRERLTPERDARGRYQHALGIITPTFTERHMQARYGKAQHSMTAADLPSVSVSE